MGSFTYGGHLITVLRLSVLVSIIGVVGALDRCPPLESLELTRGTKMHEISSSIM